MTKKTLMIDCDDVLRDTIQRTLEVYKKHYDSGSQLTKEQLVDWDIGKFFPKLLDGMPVKRVSWNYFFSSSAPHREEVFLEAKEIRGIEVLRSLREKYFIHIATNQDNGNEELTVRWLLKHDVLYDFLSFTREKQWVRAHVYVDDSVRNLEKCKNYGLAVCYSQPWNKEWNGERISSLFDLEKILAKYCV